MEKNPTSTDNRFSPHKRPWLIYCIKGQQALIQRLFDCAWLTPDEYGCIMGLLDRAILRLKQNNKP